MLHKRELKKFLKKISLAQKNGVKKSSFLDGHMWRQIPVGLLTVEFKKARRTTLFVEGEEFREFKRMLRNLRKDISTEYLKDKELEDELWYLLCDVYLNKKRYGLAKELDNRVSNFLSQICKPLKDYDVIFRVYNLKVKNVPLQIWDCTIDNLSETNLIDMKLNLKGNSKDKMFSEFTGGPAIIVRMSGNNMALVEERAREKAEFILKVAKTYLYEHMSIRDQNLLFEISELALSKREDLNKWFWSWKSKRKPYGLTISNDTKSFIDNANNHFAVINNLIPDFQSRIKRAIYWTGASIQEELIDHKMIYLCTALETLLTNKDDTKKGEVITYRMVIVNHLIEGSFPEPFQLMLFYELRSRVVHGSALNETTYSDYSTLHYIARKTLFNSICLAERHNIKKYTEFIKIMESKENLKLIRSYFAKFKGKWPESILKILDARL